MKKTILSALAAGFILFSCSKSDDPAPVNPAADKYMSITAGSTWNFAYTDNLDATNNGTYTLTSLNRDSTAFGKSYHVFSNSDGGNEYYNISSSDYYTLQAFSLGATDTTLENLYLKDGATVNTTWAQNYTIDAGVAVPVTITNKIQEKDITKVVNGTSYSGVIHVITTISAPTLTAIPGASLTSDILYYYAPKYGMIENDAKLDVVVPGLIDQHVDSKTTLTSATIL